MALKDPAKRRAYQKAWRASRKEHNRLYEERRHLRKFYGMPIEEYARMHARQSGLCAICLEKPTKGHGQKLHVDHCHDTGRVRGLLCTMCNLAIGNMGDDPARLRAAAAYIEAHREI